MVDFLWCYSWFLKKFVVDIFPFLFYFRVKVVSNISLHKDIDFRLKAYAYMRFSSKCWCVLVDFSIHFEFRFIFLFACKLECVIVWIHVRWVEFYSHFCFSLIISDSKRLTCIRFSLKVFIQCANDWPPDASLYNSVNSFFLLTYSVSVSFFLYILIYALHRCLCVIHPHVQYKIYKAHLLVFIIHNNQRVVQNIHSTFDFNNEKN